MKKPLALAGVVALALFTAGCSETLKEFWKRVAPEVACAKAEREHAAWVADGKPIDRGGAAEKEVARKVIEVAYGKTKEFCASRGIIIQ